MKQKPKSPAIALPKNQNNQKRSGSSLATRSDLYSNFHLPLKWEFKTSDDTSIVQSYNKRYFIAVNAVENFQKAIWHCCKVPSTF